MTPELEVLKTVTGRLDAAAVPYMVTGSMAANYYAVPRMTRDIDIVIEAAAADTERLIGLFRADFYIAPETVGPAIAERTAFNVIHTASVVKVDFLLRKDSAYRREEFRRRRRVAIDDIDLSIVAVEDLIISKLDRARDSRSEVQLADVRNVLRANPELDLAYLEHWIARLGLDALYREVRG